MLTRWTTAGSCLVVVAVMAMLSVSWALAGPPIDAQATWTPDAAQWDRIPRCYGQQAIDRCLVGLMQQWNAPAQAVDFAKLVQAETNYIGFARYFTETGPVDLVGVIYPFRKSVAFQYAMVNGASPLIITDRNANVDISGDPLYPSLHAAYPKLQLGVLADYNSVEPLPAGGQRFIFTYTLGDGCERCQANGSAKVAFDFDAVGTFLGTKLMSLSASAAEEAGLPPLREKDAPSASGQDAGQVEVSPPVAEGAPIAAAAILSLFVVGGLLFVLARRRRPRSQS